MYGRHTDLCKENQMFLDGQIVKQNVVLRTQAEACAHLINVVPNVEAVDDGRSTRRRKKTCIAHRPTSQNQPSLLGIRYAHLV